MIHYKFIAIEGNIGAGKSTLAKFLHESFGGSLLMEEFEENSSLKEFYNNPAFALNAELQFVLDRSLQMSRFHESKPNFVISDYIPLKSLIFAQSNLTEKEFSVYEPVASKLLDQYPKPDLVIFLKRTPEELLENIKKRGRSYEQGIQSEYLEKVQEGYEKYLFEMSDCPILEIQANEIDLNKPKELASSFQRVLQGHYANFRRQIDLKSIMQLNLLK